MFNKISKRRLSPLVMVALVFLATITACSEPSGPVADVVYTNGHVYTMDQEMTRAEAVATLGGDIMFVGSSEDAMKLAGENTKTVDLAGKMLLPGFIDTHMHPIAGGAYARALSLETWGSVEDWEKAIAEYAEANKDAPLLFGYGFLATAFGPVGPTRQLIDAIVPDKPVIIMDEGFHAAWVNTAALEALNIDQDTPDPVPNFSYYKRDAEGNATGYLLEGTAGMAMGALNVITQEVIMDGTAHVIDVMNGYGLTAAFDAGVGSAEENLPQILGELESRGDMTIRLVGAYRPGGPDEAAEAPAMAEQWRNTMKGERYHYRMMKIMDDGTVEGRTAAMFEDYQGEPGNSGETVYTQEEMNMMVVGATSRDIDIHIHALGERAIHEALNAIELARTEHPDSTTRFAICHIQVITDEDLPRFAELDVIGQSTPLWSSYDTYGEQFVSEDQFNRFWRYNSLHKLGVRLTFGSDFPASGAGMLGMSPIFNIQIGHTRQEPDDPEGPIQPLESERLDIETLIRGYTSDAAYQLHMEDEIGTIEVGKKADLVVLDQDLFEVDMYDIHAVKVEMTVLDGDVVYESTP